MNASHAKRPRLLAKRQHGFALIVVLMMMVLISILALGLLGLSSVTLRSGAADMARQEARANSRLALMLAIGELQKQMGPDQRISARSSAVNGQKGEKNVLGSWESWHWKVGFGSPDYKQKASKFKGWLTSAPTEQQRLDPAYPASEFTNPVWLINPQTVGTRDGAAENGPGLRAEKVDLKIGQRNGSFAWAVMDEAQKAPVNLAKAAPSSTAEKIAQRTAPPRTRPESLVEGLSPDQIGEPRKLVSVPTAVIATGGKKEVLALQEDVTTDSLGLLTNVSEGGLRSDLTTLFEADQSKVNFSTVLGSYGPYGSVGPGNNADPTAATDSAPSWDYLRNHYQLYRDGRLSGADGGQPVFKYSDAKTLSSGVNVGKAAASGNAVGTLKSPTVERLLPVISKFQIMYSAVTHYCHITDRVDYYNSSGQPQGNQNYFAPHLVYDPVVTLYNPYDVALDLPQLRLRIWDAPILFGFKKNGEWLRSGFASGYQPLSRFTINTEKDDKARKSFTLLLRDAKGGTPGQPIRLAPGEVRVFSAWVEPKWNWAIETAGQYNVYTFFDYDTNRNFGKIDPRTGNKLGVETVPGWDPRAGFQTDHLASTYDRPATTNYSWDTKSKNTGWVVIKKDETFSVHAEAGHPLATSGTSDPDFQVDLMQGTPPAGSEMDPASDTLLRSYSFKLKSPATELSLNGVKPVIDRTFKAGDLLQAPADMGVGGKTPFAIFTMAAKTTADPNDNSRPWVHNHPVIEGPVQDTNTAANALDSYDLTLNEVADFNTFPGIEIDPGSNRGFYGASTTANRGVSNVPMFRVPLMPAVSLGDLVTANAVPGSALPRVTHPLGNSRAHPLIPVNAAVYRAPGASGNYVDHSYCLNDALWDRFFFSTVGTFNGGLVNSGTRLSLLTGFLKGDKQLLNRRFTPLVSTTTDPTELAKQLDGTAEGTLAKKMAASIGVRGAFNVNSDSVPAWTAFIASMRDAAIAGWGNMDMTAKDKTAFPRFTLPISGAAEDINASSSIDVQGARRWAGFRSLTDDQIKSLATAIVTRIRERGAKDKAPFLTLGEFVNRRVATTNDPGSLAGVLQQAIDDSGVNDAYNSTDAKMMTAVPNMTGLVNADARQGYTSAGSPATITQGDLVSALAPVMTVRGDTFRIRAYGESRTSDGKIAARAWCEAVVQRMPSYVDPKDAPEVLPSAATTPVNQTFGRRFDIVSFRWLEPKEI